MILQLKVNCDHGGSHYQQLQLPFLNTLTDG